MLQRSCQQLQLAAVHSPLHVWRVQDAAASAIEPILQQCIAQGLTRHDASASLQVSGTFCQLLPSCIMVAWVPCSTQLLGNPTIPCAGHLHGVQYAVKDDVVENDQQLADCMCHFCFKASREQLHERDGFIWLLGWLQATLERLKFHNWDPNGMPLYSLLCLLACLAGV